MIIRQCSTKSGALVKEFDRIFHNVSVSLSNLSGWATLGLQFENMVLNNRDKIFELLNLRAENMIANNPFLQKQTSLKMGCQIDYLIQTKFRTLYACETKFSRQSINRKGLVRLKKKSIDFNCLDTPLYCLSSFMLTESLTAWLSQVIFMKSSISKSFFRLYEAFSTYQ